MSINGMTERELRVGDARFWCGMGFFATVMVIAAAKYIPGLVETVWSGILAVWPYLAAVILIGLFWCVVYFIWISRIIE